MKKILFVMLLFLYVGMAAQEKNINLDDFKFVKVSKGLKVNFTKAEDNRALITGSNKNKIKFKVKKDILFITTSINHPVTDDETFIEIFFKDIQGIVASENSSIEFCARIEQPAIEMIAREGADIMANIEVETFLATAGTGGNLDVRGKANLQEIEVKSAGEFKGENLIGKIVNVSLNGSGKANVYSKDYVKATARAGGHIYIYGNPKQIEEHTSYGGIIKKIN